MELVLKCKGVKRGKTKDDKDWLMISYGDGITGFVPYDDMQNFVDIQRGDFVETDVYNFTEDGGIKFIPRCIVKD